MIDDAHAWRVTRIVTNDGWEQNGYVMEHPSSGVVAICDPGGSTGQYLSAIEAAKARGCSRVILFVTHGHHDHVGAVQPLCDALDVDCLIHPGDHRLVRQAALYSLRIVGRVIATPQRVGSLSAGPLAAAPSLEVIATPGHTLGSVTVLAGAYALTGDTLLREAIGRTDLPGGNAEQLAASVDSLLARLDDETVILPGHGNQWTVGAARAWWAGARTRLPLAAQTEQAH